MAVAEKVLRGQGIGAWPVCGNEGRLGERGEPVRAGHHEGGTEEGGAEAGRRDEGRAGTRHDERGAAAVVRRRRVRGPARGHAVGDRRGAARRRRLAGLHERNRAVVGDDPGLIFPGQRLRLRSRPSARPVRPAGRDTPRGRCPACSRRRDATRTGR
ncbi:hypothetical protein V2I01_36390 [Micromonospora sp. BRA006-A]|nr:hypothetical protein [Micromonospora sp. BRA006-A]